jgi:hypothetical protein
MNRRVKIGPPDTIASSSVLASWPRLTGSRFALSASISRSVFTFLSSSQFLTPTPSNRSQLIACAEATVRFPQDAYLLVLGLPIRRVSIFTRPNARVAHSLRLTSARADSSALATRSDQEPKPITFTPPDREFNALTAFAII